MSGISVDAQRRAASQGTASANVPTNVTTDTYQTLTHIREVQMPRRLGASPGSKKHSLAFSASIRGRCTARIGNGGIREERREVVIHPPPNTQHLPKIMTTSPSLDMEPGDNRRQSRQVASREEDFCEFKFSLS